MDKLDPHGMNKHIQNGGIFQSGQVKTGCTHPGGRESTSGSHELSSSDLGWSSVGHKSNSGNHELSSDGLGPSSVDHDSNSSNHELSSAGLGSSSVGGWW